MMIKRLLMGLTITVALQPYSAQAVAPGEAFRNLFSSGQKVEQHLCVEVPRFYIWPLFVIAGCVCVGGYTLVRTAIAEVHLWRLQRILSLMPDDNFQDTGWKQIKTYSFSDRIRAMMLLVKKQEPEQALRFACYAFDEHEKELFTYKKACLWVDAAASVQAL